MVAVARKGQAPLSQIAKGFGIYESCLHRWLKLADIDEGTRPGVTAAESAEVRELRRYNKLLKQENEVLRPRCGVLRPRNQPKMTYPLVLDLAAEGIPVAVTCRALGFSKQAFYAWKKQSANRRDRHEVHLINAAIDLHHDDPAFGTGSSPMSSLPAHHRWGEPGGPVVFPAVDLVGVRQETGPAPTRRARRCTTIWSAGSSARPGQTCCG